MAIINSIFQKHAYHYLDSLDKPIGNHLRNVIKAICLCRTGELGLCHYHVLIVSILIMPNDLVGNRHCPQCQGQKAAHWLQRQLKNRLPCNYFMLTFTLPDKLRSFVEKNQQHAYSFMFDAAHMRLRNSAKTNVILDVNPPDSAPFSIPGVDSYNTIPISMLLSLPEELIRRVHNGCPLEMISSCL